MGTMKKGIISIFILIAMIFVSGLVFAGKIEKDIEQSFELFSSGISEMDVDIRNGALIVKAWDGDSIKVEGTLYVQGSGNLDEELGKIRLVSQKKGKVQQIYLDYPKYMESQFNFNFGCSADVYVPQEFFDRLSKMTLDTSNGLISLSDFNGNISSDTSNASIYHENIGGNVHADSSNGEIVLKDIAGTVYADTSNAKVSVNGCPNEVEIDTSNGEIVLENITGDITADTSNGPVSAENITGNLHIETSSDNVSLKNVYGEVYVDSSNGEILLDNCNFTGTRNVLETSNGSITGNLILPEKGRLTIDTSNGSIRLFLPAYSNARFTADTSNGVISFENIPVTFTKDDKRYKEGYLNSGEGVTLELDTSNGSIIIAGQ